MSSNLRALWESAGGSTPEHWEFKTIEELLEHSKSVSVGVMYPGPDVENGVPLIKVSDVKNGAIAKQPEFCIGTDVDEEYKRSRLNGSELLITLVGNPGDCVVATKEMAGWNAARALAVVRLEDIGLRAWLRYALLSKPAKHLIEARLNTTVQKTLNLKDIRELGIPLPPQNERESITEIIDLIEAKMLLNRQTNQTLEHIAQAIFKSWFVDFEPTRAKITAKQAGQDPERAAMAAISGKTLDEFDQLSSAQLEQLKTTAALFPDALVDSELGEVPEGWEVKPLGQCIDVKHGYAFKGEYFSNEPTDNILLTPGNFKIGGGFKFDKLKYYNGPMPEGYVLERNDLLITMTDLSKKSDTLGFPALVSKVSAFTFLHNQRLGKVISKEGVLKKYFMYFLLKSHRYRSEIIGGATGTTVKHTAPKKVLAYKYAFQGELEGTFDSLVESIYSRIESNMNENESLIQIRNSLLPKLLSGELPIPNTEERTAATAKD